MQNRMVPHCLHGLGIRWIGQAGRKAVYPQARSITPGELFWLQTPCCNDTVKRSQMAASDIALEKGLPANIDAEKFVLGAILLDDTNFIQVAGFSISRTSL